MRHWVVIQVIEECLVVINLGIVIYFLKIILKFLVREYNKIMGQINKVKEIIYPNIIRFQ